MTAVSDVMSVCYHQFGIVDGPYTDLPITRRRTNALVDTAPGAAVVTTGIHTGLINVTVDVRDNPPTALVTDDWDEVVELSIALPRGEGRLAVLMSAVPDTFPPLTPSGPGPYRLRVHARGRDTAIDGTAFEPVEDYLIAIWPAPLTRQTIHKETDRYGAGWHRYDPDAPDPIDTPAPTPPPPPAERPRRLLAHTRDATHSRNQVIRFDHSP